MLNSKKITIAIGTIILLAAVLFFKKLSTKEAPLFVRVGPVTEAVYGLGTVSSNKEFSAKFAIPVGIRDILVKEGDLVKKGAALLITDEGVSVRAPFNGTITHINHNIGETIFPQVPILTLVDLQDLSVVVSLEQQAALKVRAGLKVKMSFESLGHAPLEGVIKSVLPLKDQFLAHIQVPTLPNAVLPGMSADVAIIVGEKKDAVLVPKKVVINNNIMIKKRGDANIQKLKITTGLSDGEFVEVLTPLLSNQDEIIIPAS